MTASHLLTRLERHLVNPADPGGVFAREVCVNGESGQGRRCDALHAGFTRASGMLLAGFEVKVSRADWRTELENPSKAETWASACHEWWIVAPSTDVVPVEELPAGWGLLLPPAQERHTRFRIAKPATRRDPETFSPPWWAVRSFMARLSTLERKDTNAIRRALLTQVTEEVRAAEETRLAAARTDAQESLARVRAVEEALGCSLWGLAEANGRRSVTLDELREIGAALKTNATIRDALASLAVKRDDWSRTAIDKAEKVARTAVDLIDALAELRRAATAPTETALEVAS